jgi:MFS transporter, AAHS family, benzoate transport protein
MKVVNVKEVIDYRKPNSFFRMMFVCCMLILVFDGYDLNVFGVVVPSIMEETKLTPTQIGLLGSYALLGMMIGATIFGYLADKFGRKTIIIICVALYSIFTGCIGFAQDMNVFAVLRFLAGMVLGGVTTNVLALVSEYSPKKNRGFYVTLANIGVPMGSIIATLSGILFLEEYSWRVLFLVGFIPIILAFISIYCLPESMVHLIKKGDNKKISKTLQSINLGIPLTGNEVFVLSDQANQPKTSILNLFRSGYLRNTVLLSIAFLLVTFIIAIFMNWLPKLMMEQGYPLGSSLWLLLTFTLGSFISSPLGGKLADKYGYKISLVSYTCIAAISILMLSIKTNLVGLSIIIFIAGAAVNGILPMLLAYSSQNYPLTFVSTAMGFNYSIGRLGGVIGPTVGGVLLSMQVPLWVYFVIMAIAAVLCALAVILTKNYVEADLKATEGLTMSPTSNDSGSSM